MQAEIDSIIIHANPSAPRVHILGVNEAGQELGNPSITNGRVIPWLQDTSSQDVWSKWDVTYRDVVILDANNKKVDVYNLTEHNLADSASYATLKGKLLDQVFPIHVMAPAARAGVSGQAGVSGSGR